MNHQRICSIVAMQVVALFLVSCGGGGSGSPTTPDLSVPGAPGGFNMTGTWSGTLARPNGSLISFRWAATQDSLNLRVGGPLTLTLGGTTASGTLSSNIGMAPGGTSSNPVWQMHGLGIEVNPGGVAGFPNCQIVSEETGSVSVTSTTLTSGNFKMRYSNCDGLIERAPGSGPVSEVAQLTMTKTP